MARSRVDFPFSPQLSPKLCPIRATKTEIKQKRFLFFEVGDPLIYNNGSILVHDRGILEVTCSALWV